MRKVANWRHSKTVSQFSIIKENASKREHFSLSSLPSLTWTSLNNNYTNNNQQLILSLPICRRKIWIVSSLRVPFSAIKKFYGSYSQTVTYRYCSMSKPRRHFFDVQYCTVQGKRKHIIWLMIKYIWLKILTQIVIKKVMWKFLTT